MGAGLFFGTTPHTGRQAAFPAATIHKSQASRNNTQPLDSGRDPSTTPGCKRNPASIKPGVNPASGLSVPVWVHKKAVRQ